MSLPTLPSVLSSLFGSEDGFVAYTGAGISIASPSCAPNWWSLTQEIMKAFFSKCDQSWLPPNFSTAGGIERQPEMMFENFGALLGTDFYEVFKCLDFGSPNDTHKVIALMAKCGVLKACYTTNFDIYIERALDELGVEYERLVDNEEYDNYDPAVLFQKGQKAKFLLCKIHGTVDRPESIVSTSSVYRTSKGFAPPKSRVLDYLLERVPCLFLGYSGWDFEHENYRKYWSRIGPSIKKIYWNKRPAEKGGPNFQEIFHGFFDKIQFCEADLPDGLIDSIQYLADKNITRASQPQGAWDILLSKRAQFFESWSESLSQVQRVGIVLIDAASFSEDSKKGLELIKERSEGTQSIADVQKETQNLQAIMMDLSMQMSRGEITLDQYMTKIQDHQMDMMLSTVPPKYKEIAKMCIKENRIPGVTDDPSKKFTFASQISFLLPRFDGDLDGLIEITKHHNKLVIDAQSLEEPRRSVETTFLNIAYPLYHKDESYYMSFWKESESIKEKAISGEIDMLQFTSELSVLLKKATDKSSGIVFDFKHLFQTQRDYIVQLLVGGDIAGAEKNLEIYIISIMMNIYNYIYELTQISEMKNHMFYDDIPLSLLQILDQTIRTRLQPLLNEIEKYSNGAWTKLRVLSEFLVFATFVHTIAPRRSPNRGKYPVDDPRAHYTIYTNPECTYLPKGLNMEAFEYLAPHREWIPKLFDVSPKIIQRASGFLLSYAEMGKDYELCKLATEKSLESSDGLVNQQTPEDIPLSYCYILEEQGKYQEALEYYTLALDSIKFYSPPNYGDIIVFRAVVMNELTGDKLGALKVLAKYHPAFGANASYVHLGARKVSLEYGERIAKEVGFSCLKDAVDMYQRLGHFELDSSINTLGEQNRSEVEEQERKKKEQEEKEKKELEQKREEEEKKKKEEQEKKQREEEEEEERRKKAEEEERRRKEEEEELQRQLAMKNEEEKKKLEEEFALKRKKEEEERKRREKEEEEEEEKKRQEQEEKKKKEEEERKKKEEEEEEKKREAKEKEEQQNEIKGYLFKLGGNKFRKTFQRRYFVYHRKEELLEWYKNQGGNKKNSLSLKFVSKVEFFEGQKFGRSFVFSLVTEPKTYYLSAENKDDFVNWKNSLSRQ